jgi:CMP-N-acetylneuraminic acid synthetase
MDILAVITARGGSKGLPGKNIKPLGGKPLIAYSIEAAKKSARITDLILSTDDEAIAAVAREHGCDVPFMRPAELAQDSTPHLPVLQHAVAYMEEAKGARYDLVVTLQPTSPFRLPEDIDKTIDALVAQSADSAVSVCELESSAHPIKAKKLQDGLMLPYCIPEPEGVRRQDFPAAYKRSAAVYVSRRDLIVDRQLFYGDRIAAHIVPQDRSIDIDTPLDWLVAEYKLGKLQAQGLFV